MRGVRAANATAVTRKPGWRLGRSTTTASSGPNGGAASPITRTHRTTRPRRYAVEGFPQCERGGPARTVGNVPHDAAARHQLKEEDYASLDSMARGSGRRGRLPRSAARAGAGLDTGPSPAGALPARYRARRSRGVRTDRGRYLRRGRRPRDPDRAEHLGARDLEPVARDAPGRADRGVHGAGAHAVLPAEPARLHAGGRHRFGGVLPHRLARPRVAERRLRARHPRRADDDPPVLVLLLRRFLQLRLSAGRRHLADARGRLGGRHGAHPPWGRSPALGRREPALHGRAPAGATRPGGMGRRIR